MKPFVVLLAVFAVGLAFQRIFPKAYRRLRALRWISLVTVWFFYGLLAAMSLHKMAKWDLIAFQLDPPGSITERQAILTQACIVEVQHLDHKIWLAAVLGPFAGVGSETLLHLLGVALFEYDWSADDCSLWLHCARHQGSNEKAYLATWASEIRKGRVSHAPIPHPERWVSES